MEVRSIIKEATVRINLVPRKQAVPGDILETGYRLLKGVVNKYNYDNLLNFTQNAIVVDNSMMIHLFDETDYMAGKNNLYFDTVESLEAYEIDAEDKENKVWAMVKSDPETFYTITSVGTPSGTVYVWVPHLVEEDSYNISRLQQMQLYCRMQHVHVKDVAKVNSLYLVTPVGRPYFQHYEIKFIPADKFDDYTNDARVFTVVQKSEGEWFIRLKPYLAAMKERKIKINYNESIDFDLDDDLFIPDNYVELLIVALAHKLAIQYPRLDEAQMARLETEVRVLVDNVRTPKAITKMVLRDQYDYFDNHTVTQSELLGGYWV